uniref:Ovule protein n=1 Tax=Heterorhabditis bacteriophora TaxID=37862 RepID=A0A1I7WEE8_HETBA
MQGCTELMGALGRLSTVEMLDSLIIMRIIIPLNGQEERFNFHPCQRYEILSLLLCSFITNNSRYIFILLPLPIMSCSSMIIFFNNLYIIIFN